jgi:hypothetical protein
MVGRPRRRPECVIAGRGYDHDKYLYSSAMSGAPLSTALGLACCLVCFRRLKKLTLG